MRPPATPPSTRRAVIDIGTNSVKLLVAEVQGRDVQPLLEKSEQTRLGRGFYDNHWLQREAIDQTARVVNQFSEKAARLGVQSLRLIATSAVRDARNQEELLGAIRQASGLRVEVITGEQEADWVFLGVTSHPRLAAHPLLILDVGGGSTEFVLGQGSVQSFRNSFSLGAVRLWEQLHPSDPPQLAELARCRELLRQFMLQEIHPALDPALNRLDRRSVQLVGAGGSATNLATMQLAENNFNREHIESLVLTRAQVSARVERLWQLNLAERKELVGLPSKRADVILTGSAIYEAVMEQFQFSELRVSTRGLRYAALMEEP